MGSTATKPSKGFKFKYTLEGTLLSGALITCAEALKLGGMVVAPMTTFLTTCSLVIGGAILDHVKLENDYNKLFRNCGLVNKDDEMPLVIKKETKDKKTTLVIHMPPGLSQKHFEQKQEELEQTLKSKIKFGYNKNLIMELIEMDLKTMYQYAFEECKEPLQIYIGNTHEGKFIINIEKCPHIIIAGETDSGKSSLLDVIALSLILNKFDVELRLIDFQGVTLGKYENCKKVKSYGETPEEFEKLLDELAVESKKRLELFRSVKNKHFIEKLSKWNKYYPEQCLPPIVVMVDEFSKLSDDAYAPILAKFRERISMDRKVGIFYICAMQRPDIKCIAGNIKANMPCRIAFKTVTDSDSEVILDQFGAEKLKNQGRFLIKYCGELTEVQALYAEPDESIRKILKQNKKFKTRDDLELEKRLNQEKQQQERQKVIDDFRAKYNNPYKKDGDAS